MFERAGAHPVAFSDHFSSPQDVFLIFFARGARRRARTIAVDSEDVRCGPEAGDRVGDT